MKTLIKVLPFVLIASACSGGNETEAGGGSANAIAKSGSASLSIGEESHELDLDLCIGPMKIKAAGMDTTTFSIEATKPNITLYITGTKASTKDVTTDGLSVYTVEVDGGASKGGTTYRQDMPFDVFDGHKLDFKGATKAKTADGETGAEIPIEFTVTCK